MADERDFLQRLRAAPAIDAERQRLAHARIVERFFLGVERHDQAAHPRRFLDHGLVAQRLDQAVAVGRRMAAEFGHDFSGRERVDHRRAGDEQGQKAIQIGLALLEIAVETAPAPVRTGDMLDKRERAGAHHVALRPARIGFEFGRAVNAVPRARKVRQHRRIRLLQLEDDGQRIGRVDRGDVGVALFPQGQHALRRLADAVVGRLDVFGRQRRSVVKLDALFELERVGQPVLGHGPRIRNVAHDLRILRGVELEQRRIMRAHWMDERERGLRVAIVVGRLGAHGEFEQAAGDRRFRGEHRRTRASPRRTPPDYASSSFLSPPAYLERRF